MTNTKNIEIMKKYLYCLLICALLFQSCDSGDQGETKASSEETLSSEDTSNTEDAIADPAHNSRNALDWHGTYEGVLPCEDCEGIQTTITLEENDRFSRKLIYTGKSKTPLLSAGKYDWNEAGSTVTLKSFKGNDQVFKVGENKLIYQAEEGIEGEFILRKVKEMEGEAV